jgi:hypothetical protein
VPYKHRKSVEIPSTPHLCQFSVDPPDPVGILEADPNRLSLNGEHLRLPRPPHPARFYPLGEPLGLGHVSLYATLRVPRRTPPL